MNNKVYEVKFTNIFKKQYSKIKNNPHFKQEEFDNVIKILSNNEVLPEKYNNHLLQPKHKLAVFFFIIYNQLCRKAQK